MTSLLALSIAGCAAPHATRSDRCGPARVAGSSTPEPAPSAILSDGARQFGRALDPNPPHVALRDLVLDSDRYAGQVVTTQGIVSEVVCRGMGCWLRIATAPSGEAVIGLVAEPYFVPRDLRGRQIVAQGRVARAAGSDGAVHVDATGIEVR